MGGSNTQRKERQAYQCNGQATIEISRSARFTLLLLVRSCIFEVIPDCEMLCAFQESDIFEARCRSWTFYLRPRNCG